MRECLISIWSLLDPLYDLFTRKTFLSSGEGNIFRVRLTKYKGQKFVLSDGTEINKNDLLLKVRLHNIRLLTEFKSITSELKKARMIYSYVQKSLPEIDTYIQSHTQSHQIKGIIGITSLNKGCERLGFEVFDVTDPVYRWFKQISFLPITMLSSKNRSFFHLLKTNKPSYLFMSTKKLSNMYRS